MSASRTISLSGPSSMMCLAEKIVVPTEDHVPKEDREPEDMLTRGLPEYLKSRRIVHRAMQVLVEWKYVPARISASFIPVDIIAIRKSAVLLVQVIFSRNPVPDAKTLVSLSGVKIASLRMMGAPAQFRKYIMVYSPRCGWKYYEVLPGGLIPAWHLSG